MVPFTMRENPAMAFLYIDCVGGCGWTRRGEGKDGYQDLTHVLLAIVEVTA